MRLRAALLLCAFIASGNIAFGDIVITQEATQTVYDTTLTFDEVGGPTGLIDPGAYAGIGITELTSGTGDPFVGDNSVVGPWLGTDNSLFANFGLFIAFASDLSNFNVNFQDPSGDPSPIGGGAIAVAFDDGVEVGFLSFGPAWGGLGDEFINISTTGGDVFDEVRILGFGFVPTSYVDDISFSKAAIPEPTSALAICMLGLVGIGRRRR